MRHWSQILQCAIFAILAVGIGCAPPSSTTEASKPPPAESSPTESEAIGMPQMDNFDQPEKSLFEIKEPHKIEDGMLVLQAPPEGIVLESSVEGLSTEGYTVSAEVMPPEVGESVGLAVAVRGQHSRVLFYLYRPAGADPFDNRGNIGVEGHVGGRKMRAPDIRVRAFDFQPDTPIKLSARQVGPSVFLSIRDQNVGRFHEQSLRVGKVGVYGSSQHADGSPAVVKFDSFQIE